MVLSAQQEADFIKNNLGPAFQAAGLSTKIIVWDHNCDNPNYPIAILTMWQRAYVDALPSSYNGDISALSTVHNAYPDKNLYFTEQYGCQPTFSGELNRPVKNVIICPSLGTEKGSARMELGARSSPARHPVAVQFAGRDNQRLNQLARNVGYYMPLRTYRVCSSGIFTDQQYKWRYAVHAALLTPSGKKVLLVLNPEAHRKHLIFV
jgi:glucosylceramidase